MGTGLNLPVRLTGHGRHTGIDINGKRHMTDANISSAKKITHGWYATAGSGKRPARVHLYLIQMAGGVTAVGKIVLSI